jgi:hypothetical protein
MGKGGWFTVCCKVSVGGIEAVADTITGAIALNIQPQDESMVDEYVHEGLIHQEPIPRIALVNFSASTANELGEKRHNCMTILA